MENSIKGNPGKSLLRDAAVAGAIMGVLLFACMLLNEFTRPVLSEVVSIIKLLVIVGGIYIFARRRSLEYGASGFTFAQGMGYIVVTMVFTGIITGAGDYIAYNVISPDYYHAILEETFDENPLLKLYDEQMMERSLGMARTMLKNPFYFIFAGIMGKVIGGGIIGLFVSALVKRIPVPTDNE